MDMDENTRYEVPECDDRPRYGGALGEDDDSVSNKIGFFRILYFVKFDYCKKF